MNADATTTTEAPVRALPRFQPVESGGRARTIVAMLLCALAVFLMLPFTQYISGGGAPTVELRSVDVMLPPPPPPPPEPPPPEQEEIDEPPPPMHQPPPPLSLSQMELALSPGIGDALAGAFSFEGFGVQPDAVGDMAIFDVADLDRPPRRTRTIPPVYPAELKRARVQGEVLLIVIIDQQGNCSVERVAEASAREFAAAATAAAEQCLFEPPMKNGEAVRARYSMRVPFRIQ